MAKIRYIDPEFKESLEQVRPIVRKEVGYSFDISKLNIPGNDSVSVTFETQGQDKSTIKVPRTIFNYAQ